VRAAAAVRFLLCRPWSRYCGWCARDLGPLRGGQWSLPDRCATYVAGHGDD